MITSISPEKLAAIVSANVHKLPDSNPVSQVSIDSRKIFLGAGTVFFALQGNQANGHTFLKACHHKGVRNFVISKEALGQIENALHTDSNIYLVDNPLHALQSLATWHRAQFKGPVVGITGSNGKTIVKEWLGQLLSNRFETAKSPKSFNSQVGVPLSIFSMAAYHQVAVLEAGISQPGEMQRLEEMIGPDIGILTNIGTAHGQNFSSKGQKLAEKLSLFAQSKLLIYRKDNPAVAGTVERLFPKEKCVSWSDEAGADYTLRVKKQAFSSRIFLVKPDSSMYTFSTRFTDDASLENLRHAIVAASILGLDLPSIQEGIQQLSAIDMRLAIKSGRRQCTLIDDTYNNDLAGLEIALDFMETQRKKRQRVLVLSDFPQIKHPEEVYLRVNQLLNHYQIDQLVGIGHDIAAHLQSIPTTATFFVDTEAFLASPEINTFSDDLILIKGARTFGFERIVQALEEQIHGTVLEINLNALSQNYYFYKRRLPPATKLMAMVKAAAYGGGATEIANHLQKLQVDYLSVAYSDEGAELREKGITLPIMVLNVASENAQQIVRHGLEPVLYSPRILKFFGEYAKNEGVEIAIHLDMDSGMRRLGFDGDSIQELIALLTSYPELRVQSIFTHLTSTDNPEHDDYSLAQLEKFRGYCTKIIQTLGYKPLTHALNTAGILRFPAHTFDMVRLGIGLYGVGIDELSKGKLHQVGTLKTTISQIKHLKKGEHIGYNRMGVMPADGCIGTIGLGYADGYDRRFSNGVGYVIVNGKRAPVIGNICMDMTMVDLTGIEAQEGDVVTVYGEGIDLLDLSERVGTIPYELLTRISRRVKRVYFLD